MQSNKYIHLQIVFFPLNMCMISLCFKPFSILMKDKPNPETRFLNACTGITTYTMWKFKFKKNDILFSTKCNKITFDRNKKQMLSEKYNYCYLKIIYQTKSLFNEENDRCDIHVIHVQKSYRLGRRSFEELLTMKITENML